MKALQNKRREIETLGPRQVLEYKSLMYRTRLTCYTPLNKRASKLHILRVLLKGVNQGKRVFALVKIFAEAFLGSIL
jgi:hypothetical protein